MNRLAHLQRAVSLRKPAPAASPSSSYDAFDWMYARSGAAVNGEFEVAAADLQSVSQRLYKASGQIFALMEWRRRAFCDVRFQWQQLNQGRPGDLFGNGDLAALEQPWTNGTTSTLLSRMINHADLLGNSYVTWHPRLPGQLRLLRPDWVFTVWGSDDEPELFGDALDAELLGYVYAPRTRGMFEPKISEILLPEDVAHFAPTPDPEAHSMGMSWLTPVVREVATDLDTTRHKQMYFRNGASSRLAVKVDESVDEDDFKRMVAMIEANNVGVDNAYRTLYLAGGADPVQMSHNLKDVDFSKVQGAGEVRLANAAGVPAPVAGLAEALQGSSLNAGNLQAEIQLFIDLTVRDLWASAAGALESILTVPASSRLWYDTRETAVLGDNADAASKIRAADSTTMSSLITQGFDPASVVAYIASNDPKSLKHTGRVSVQLQDAPSSTESSTTTTSTTPTEGE